jgi:hypothetical protein
MEMTDRTGSHANAGSRPSKADQQNKIKQNGKGISYHKSQPKSERKECLLKLCLSLDCFGLYIYICVRYCCPAGQHF